MKAIISPLLAAAALAAPASAFAPAARSAAATTALFATPTNEAWAPRQAGVSGDEVRGGWSTYAAHGTGEIGSTVRAPPQAGTVIGSVIGDEVREARATYAAHGTGEVGSTARGAFVPNSTGTGAPWTSVGDRDDDGDWRT